MSKILPIEKVRKIITEKYPNSFFNSVSYKEYKSIEDSRYRNKQQVKNLTIYKSKTPYIILLTVACFFLFTFPFFNSGNITPYFVKIIYGLCFLTIIISSYQILFTKKLYISLNEKSLKIKNREINWNEILTTGILFVHAKASRQLVILGLESGEIFKIDIDKTDISSYDFIKIIHLHKN